jgi:hypothetical protein
MLTRRISRSVLGAMVSVALLCAQDSWAAQGCGDGVLSGGEECDGGPGGLFIDGDPAGDACTGGSRCYFEYTCCKFNCQYVGTPGAPCQDGNTCTGPDSCNQIGECIGGPDAANDTPCDDGLFCTGVESCQDGVCLSSTGDPCPGTACRNCQEETDSCFDPTGSSCSDGSVCITGGACDGSGTCTGGIFNAGPCDDGLHCNGSDTCLDGACAVHSGDPCSGPDEDADCLESCDETLDLCSAPDPEDSPCDDGLFCNGAADRCTSGLCAGTDEMACDDGNDCTTDGCNELTDRCSTVTTSPDGTACSDRDPCTLDDACTSGVCIGTPTALEDFCPWTLVLRENDRKDLIRSYYETSVVGDVCGGTIKLYGKAHITSDVVSDEAAGERQLMLDSDVVIGNDIVSSGGGAAANPRTGHLPYLTPMASTLAPSSLVGKGDGTGMYDLTGRHPLVDRCHAARTAFALYTADLDALAQTATQEPIRLSPFETATITAARPGELNVIDLDGSIRVGEGALLTLDGAGDPDTVVVLRVSGRMKLYVSAALELANGLSANHTLIYVKGRKCLVNTEAIGAGTLVCSPARFVARHAAAWIGAVYSDGKKLATGQHNLFFYTPFEGF